MTVTEIVNDLLEHKMITTEAALVLLKAEAQASINNINITPVKTPSWNPNYWYTATNTNDIPVADYLGNTTTK